MYCVFWFRFLFVTNKKKNPKHTQQVKPSVCLPGWLSRIRNWNQNRRHETHRTSISITFLPFIGLVLIMQIFFCFILKKKKGLESLFYIWVVYKKIHYRTSSDENNVEKVLQWVREMHYILEFIYMCRGCIDYQTRDETFLYFLCTHQSFAVCSLYIYISILVIEFTCHSYCYSEIKSVEKIQLGININLLPMNTIFDVLRSRSLCVW